MELLPIPGEWVIQGGAVGLVGLIVLMILRGVLVPRKVLEEVKEDRDTWRLIALKSMGQTDQLLPAAHITTKVDQALAENTRDGGTS